MWLGGRDSNSEAACFSKLVMARDFWSQALNRKWLHRSVSFAAVHGNPPDSALVVETSWRRQHSLSSGPKTGSPSRGQRKDAGTKAFTVTPLPAAFSASPRDR